MLVRGLLSEGHSHVWVLPARPPAERGVFFSEFDDTGHQHALLYGGDRGPGNLQSEVHGSDTAYFYNEQTETSEEVRRGDVNPDQPDPNRLHSHVVPVLR